jgi:transcriptional regulator with XRE-family HTH domain
MNPERLKEARIKRDWSQKDLAGESKVSFEQISRYETGKSKPHASVIKKLAYALKVSEDYLNGTSDNVATPTIDHVKEEHFQSVIKEIGERELSPKEKRVVLEFLELILIKHDVKKRVSN